MSQNLLCVSIHDVAPATLTQCRRLRLAIADTAAIPVTLLVSPAYHRQQDTDRRFDAFLSQCVAAGDELALHGYVHLDEAERACNLRMRFLREIYTQREGEFAMLDEDEARRRIDLGLAWFAQRGWQPRGFVAPAWLMSAASWRAVRSAPFIYTTTLRYFYRLPDAQAELAPCMVYSSRHALGRWASRQWINTQIARVRHRRLLRLGLHPRDAMFPETLGHARSLLACLITERNACTKLAYASMPI